MGRRKTTNEVPPFKQLRQSGSTDEEEKALRSDQATDKGGVIDSTRHSTRPSTDIRGRDHDKSNVRVGRGETREDSIATPQWQLPRQSFTDDHSPLICSGRVCQYYERTGECGYGKRCIHIHPPGVKRPELNSEWFPIRPGKPTCPFYLKNGWCGFGHTCKFHHPERNAVVGETMDSAMDGPNSGANTGSGYVVYPVPHHMPPQGWCLPMTMPPSMNQYRFVAETQFPTAPMNAGWTPWIYIYPQMTRPATWPSQEEHNTPNRPHVFESGSSVVYEFYEEEEEQNLKDSSKEEETSEYDEN